MRNSKHVFVVVLVTLVMLNFAVKAKAQDAVWLNAHAQLMTAQGALINAAGKNDIKVRNKEADAKVITAKAAWITAFGVCKKALADARQVDANTETILIDNDVKNCKAFYDKRAMNAAYKSMGSGGQAGPASKNYTPNRLSKDQLDPVAGKIYWPEILQNDEFLAERIQLDSLFSSQNLSASKVKELTDQMDEKLKGMIGQLSPAEYVSTKKFIQGLAYEPQAREEVHS